MRNPLPRVTLARIPEPVRFYWPLLGASSNLGAGARLPACWYVELSIAGWLVLVRPRPN